MYQRALAPNRSTGTLVEVATCGDRNEVNMPFGSASEGKVFVIRPWINLAASGPCNARSLRRGVRLTEPVWGIMRGGGSFEEADFVEFHRVRVNDGNVVEALCGRENSILFD